MLQEPGHPSESRDDCTVLRIAWQCNALHGEEGAEGSPHRNRDGWRHPASLAVMVTAAASLITALTGVAALLLATRG